MTTPARPSGCRGCGRLDVTTVLDLGRQPLANALLSADELDQPEPRYPLRLVFCSGCSLLQLGETVSPEAMFRHYLYRSSTSDAFVGHARALAGRLVAEARVAPDGLVVELGSNDGYLLKAYVEAGRRVIGVDPAANLADEARSNGVAVVSEFFSAAVAARIRDEHGPADIVHAHNVLAHVGNVQDVLAGVKALLSDGGVFVIETPSCRDLVDRLEFDTIYHEHVFYYSLTSLTGLLERNGLVAADVEHVPVHGGSLRVFAQVAGVAAPASPSVAAMLAEEQRIGLDGPEYYESFAARVHALGDELRRTLAGLRADGQRVAAYGAAAKGTVLLNLFGLGPDDLDFVADRNELKQGRYMPGQHVPIVGPDALVAAMPDVVLLLSWNFADEILGQQAEYRRRGGRFLLPVPAPTLV